MRRCFGFGVTRGNTGTWYFVGCGLAMAVSGWLFLKGLRLALPVYALTCALALGWAGPSTNPPPGSKPCCAPPCR